ncbi:MAG: hypothetical protein Q7U53_14140 [Anaerolineaceae bacterium]|nr:hypothetical protein [Anaerolineaceae bacterium]
MSTQPLLRQRIIVFLICVIGFASACNLAKSINKPTPDESPGSSPTSPQKADPQPPITIPTGYAPDPAPPETVAPVVLFDEGLVRMILLDIQKYPMEDYYRNDRATDNNAIEAILRWDAGVRVTNVDELEKLVIDGRMEIVRTSEPSVPIDFMEILLSTD